MKTIKLHRVIRGRQPTSEWRSDVDPASQRIFRIARLTNGTWHGQVIGMLGPDGVSVITETPKGSLTVGESALALEQMGKVRVVFDVRYSFRLHQGGRYVKHQRREHRSNPVTSKEVPGDG